jgi:hypothetical protein
VLIAGRDADDWHIDAAATAALRAEMRAQRGDGSGMIDRGPGYLELLRQGAAPKGV